MVGGESILASVI